jgi:hypothetical protein
MAEGIDHGPFVAGQHHRPEGNDARQAGRAISRQALPFPSRDPAGKASRESASSGLLAIRVPIGEIAGCTVQAAHCASPNRARRRANRHAGNTRVYPAAANSSSAG